MLQSKQCSLCLRSGANGVTINFGRGSKKYTYTAAMAGKSKSVFEFRSDLATFAKSGGFKLNFAILPKNWQ